MKKIAIVIALMLMSLLLMQFVWSIAERGSKKQDLSAEKINLALRRTAHLLLKKAGDSTSLIPPVEQINASVWLVRLERQFKYDSLPNIIQSSFQLHQIDCNYDVAVLRCADGTLLLGYNVLDYTQNKDAPCAGRDLPPDCYNLQVTLSAKAQKPQPMPMMGWFFSAVLTTILYYLKQKWQYKKEEKEENTLVEKDILHFGNSQLDVANLQLICGTIPHQLTYREAKLLHLFVQRPNQVIERTFILENVWADEGILVGRSADMFVSRLRKMLRDDATVQLVAVHGIGYKLEIN